MGWLYLHDWDSDMDVDVVVDTIFNSKWEVVAIRLKICKRDDERSLEQCLTMRLSKDDVFKLIEFLEKNMDESLAHTRVIENG